MYGKQWEKAIREEYDSIIKNRTWTLVPRPANRNIVSCKWVFKHKLDENGRIIRWKARLVARGFTQVYGMDYLDTFAPVAKMASLRILFAVAAEEDLEIQQMDVITAFLGGNLEEEIFMEQPEGFMIGNGDMVCLLGKSLYGLKQSARIWNIRIHRYLKAIGFTQSQSDHCVYINNTTGIILAMWVDDLIIFGKDMSTIDELKQQLRSEFEMKDLGDLKYFLGVHVTRNRQNRQLTIDQTTYIQMLLEKFDMQNCNAVSTPFAIGTKLKQASDGDILVDQREYQSIVGSLMYAMLCTRPDLAFAISQLSQFNSKPTSGHYAAAKHVLRYLKGTSNLTITYGKDIMMLELYSDSDYASNEDRKSISGYIGMLCGGAISWQSKKQPTVALSTTEAEYMALVQATKESIWIQRLLRELGRTTEDHKVIYGDNQGSIALANNPQYHARTKHIDIQYHFIRECVENGQIQLEYCPTEDMIADGLTKALTKDKHWKLARKMGLEEKDAKEHLSNCESGSVRGILNSSAKSSAKSSPAPFLPATPADTSDGEEP